MTMARREAASLALTGVQVAPTEALLMALYSAVALTASARERLAAVQVEANAPALTVESAHKVFVESLDRQQKYAESCVRLGIESRQVAAIERFGEAMMSLMVSVVDELGIPKAKSRPVIAAHLANALDEAP